MPKPREERTNRKSLEDAVPNRIADNTNRRNLGDSDVSSSAINRQREACRRRFNQTPGNPGVREVVHDDRFPDVLTERLETRGLRTPNPESRIPALPRLTVEGR